MGHRRTPHLPAERLELQGASGNRLVAHALGAGRPVLLMHGGGQTRHAWSGAQSSLAERGFRAVALDLRGHGESAWPADGAYAFADYAADAVAVAEALSAAAPTRPVAVGASLGGLAALLALGRRPDAFSALVLVDITPRMDPGGVSHIQGFMRARAGEGFATVEEAADAVAAYLPHRPRPKSLDGLRRNLRQDPDGRWRWHWDPRFLDGPRPIGTDHEGTYAAAVEAAKTLAVPTLLVRGRSSELVTEAAVAEFRALAPHAEYADIAGARHMVAGDRNDAFNDAVTGFLARI
jgi:pimeloyl-ACP methyl ester carboxylesterase